MKRLEFQDDVPPLCTPLNIRSITDICSTYNTFPPGTFYSKPPGATIDNLDDCTTAPLTANSQYTNNTLCVSPCSGHALDNEDICGQYAARFGADTSLEKTGRCPSACTKLPDLQALRNDALNLESGISRRNRHSLAGSAHYKGRDLCERCLFASTIIYTNRPNEFSPSGKHPVNVATNDSRRRHSSVDALYCGDNASGIGGRGCSEFELYLQRPKYDSEHQRVDDSDETSLYHTAESQFCTASSFSFFNNQKSTDNNNFSDDNLAVSPLDNSNCTQSDRYSPSNVKVKDRDPNKNNETPTQTVTNAGTKRMCVVEPETAQLSTKWSASRLELYWREMRSVGELYCPRFYHAVCRVGRKIYLFGGYSFGSTTSMHPSSSKFLNDFFEFDTGTAEWTKLTPRSASPDSRCGHSLVAHKTRVNVFGGKNESKGQMDDVWTYDKKQNLWAIHSYKGQVWCTRRAYHTAVMFENRMFVFGGTADESEGVVWFFDLSKRRWTKISPPKLDEDSEQFGNETLVCEVPHVRDKHTASVYNGSMYIFGGRLLSGPHNGQNTDELWRFCLTNYRWEKLQIGGKSPMPRAGHASVQFGRRWVIQGGYEVNRSGMTSPLNDTWYYHTIRNKWKQVTTSLVPLCHAARWGHKLLLVSRPSNTSQVRGAVESPSLMKGQTLSLMSIGGVTMTLLPLQ